MTAAELALRRRIFEAFASTGLPPEVPDDPVLRGLAEQHVVALGSTGKILMAHPFAGHRDGTRIDARGRTWWGNCAWDGLGVVAALGLHDALVTSNGVTIEITGGEPVGEALFHVSVPARRWWADIEFT